METAAEITTEISEQRYKLLQFKVQEHHLENVWAAFTRAGFEPILIKGWAAAQFYPEPHERMYSDIDLLLHPDKYLDAEKFLPDAGVTAAVDLHRGVRHLDALPFEDIFANSVLKKCGATDIRVPRDEDLLRILCVHWLTDGGAYKNRLWDIYHAVNNRKPDFDWDRCLNVVSEKRQRWILCTIGLAHKYLDLNIDDLPFKNETLKFPKWLIKSIEKEWADDTRLQPLHYFLRDRKQLWKQIKKRFPPNPIQATIELEGDFDNKPRALYQFANIFTRMSPSASRVIPSFLQNIRLRRYKV